MATNSKRNFYAVGFDLLLLAILAGLVVVALCAGKYPISAKESIDVLFGELFHRGGEYSEMTRNVVMGLRLPRITASILVGIMLAMSGVSYQSIFKNPLISPDFLGVSSGACIGAAIAILLGFSGFLLSGFAFVGGIIAVALTVFIPTAMKSDSNIMLVLSGVIVGGAMSSILGFIKYVADPETELAAITYWTMGSFSYVTLPEIGSVLPAMIIPAVILFAMSWWLDILSMGETEAKSLGANIKVIRNIAIACATLMTASSVCISGTIGWVGLVIPHFARMCVGPNNTKLIPTAGLMGGIFLLLVDTATRTLSVTEMPVSILTGLIGAPFYIIKVENLNFRYDSKGRQILNNVNLKLEEGEVMTILGPNGAGKSTLLNCIATLLEPEEGTIELCGKDAKTLKPKEVAKVISYVPQNHVPAFSYTVENFVLMGRAPTVGMFERPKAEDFAVVEQTLNEIGIGDLKDKPYTEISGGERQQATIARAIVAEPKAILFDEPTAHLDYGNQLKTLRLIKSLKEKGYAIIITTHNPDHAIMLGGTTAILDRDGNMTVGKTEEIITEETLRQLYDADLSLVKLDEVNRPICVPPDL